MAKGKERPYNASDLKELMDNTGGWAKSWNDIMRYLRGPAGRDADFSKDEVPALIADIESLKKKNFKFISDYRDVWKEISGEKSEHLPPPEGVKEPPTNPIELEDEYLKGLEFPAEKSALVQEAKDKGAPKRVLDVLKQLEDEEFKDMNGLLESVGDVAWDHD